MLTQINKMYVEKSKDLGNDQWKINFMNELIHVVHQTAESGLSQGRIIYIYIPSGILSPNLTPPPP